MKSRLDRFVVLLLLLVMQFPATETVYPYFARVRYDTVIFDTYQNEETMILRGWHVQVDYRVSKACYIEWNTLFHPETEFTHHEGWTLCSNLTGSISD